MAINISDLFNAAGTIGFTTPGTPAFLSQDGFVDAIVDNGAGDFTVEVSQPIDSTARTIQLGVEKTTFAAVTYENVDDTHIRIRTWDAAGAALDNIPVSIAIFRHRL